MFAFYHVCQDVDASNYSILLLTHITHHLPHDTDTITSDAQAGIQIPGALALKRKTEYCQWQEIATQQCQTCTRTVKAADNSSKEESYQCNCITQYDYVKTWRDRRINSLMFDQPGAHHNPQRDPMPSRTFVSEDAELTFHEGVGEMIDEVTHRNNGKGGGLKARLDPNMLSSGIRKQPWRKIDFVLNGMAPPPSYFSRLFSFFGMPKRNTRYEPLQMLKDTPYAPAATQDGFAYVGQGGYFFSPYESPSTTSKLFNYFVQYMEGSLFDWQMGDLMPSCTAGDVRFSYQVQDPNKVSVLGQLRSNAHSSGLQITPRIMNRDGSSESSVGLVHSGSNTAQQMIIAEDSDSRNAALFVRALLFLWAIPASRLAGVALGRELGESTFSVQLEGVIGVFATLLGGVWFTIWGTDVGSRDTIIFFVMGAYFGYLSFKSSVRRGGGRWLNAVWCRIGRWANVPPEWRVEDSYVVEGSTRTDSKRL